MSKRTLVLIVGLTIVTVVLLAVALLAQNNTPSTKPLITQTVSPTPGIPAETTLMLSPNPLVISSQSGSLNVEIDSGTNNLTAVQLELVYNPKLVTSIDVKPGTFFNNPNEILPKTIDQKNGRVTYAAGILPTQQPARGKGIVAVITFTTALKAGQSTTIDFLTNKSLATEYADLKNSVLKDTKGATIMYKPANLPQ